MPQLFRRMSGCVCFAVCLVLGTFFVQDATAQRLPDTVRPKHYSLILTPDLEAQHLLAVKQSMCRF